MDKDTINRLTILRQRTSSRQSPEIIYGEATNRTNPLTGKPYIGVSIPYGLDSDFFKLHVALGRMDVRDRKLSPSDSIDFEVSLSRVLEKYSKNNLDSITTTDCLNFIIEEVEREWRLEFEKTLGPEMGHFVINGRHAYRLKDMYSGKSGVTEIPISR